MTQSATSLTFTGPHRRNTLKSQVSDQSRELMLSFKNFKHQLKAFLLNQLLLIIQTDSIGYVAHLAPTPLFFKKQSGCYYHFFFFFLLIFKESFCTKTTVAINNSVSETLKKNACLSSRCYLARLCRIFQRQQKHIRNL